MEILLPGSMLGSSWTYSPSGGNHLFASRPTRELVNYWKAVAPESRDPDQWRTESSVSQQRPALWCSFGTWEAKDFPIAWMRFRKIHSLQQSFKVPSDARMQAWQMLIALEWNAKRWRKWGYCLPRDHGYVGIMDHLPKRNPGNFNWHWKTPWGPCIKS